MKTLLASASGAARKVLRSLLQRSGDASEDVEEAADRNSADAALKVSSGAPELVIVDWNLPELDAPAPPDADLPHSLGRQDFFPRGRQELMPSDRLLLPARPGQARS